MRKRTSCQIPGCGKVPVYARGWCRSCYVRERNRAVAKGGKLPEIIEIQPVFISAAQPDRPLPKTFAEFLQGCVIERDVEPRGWIEFEPFDYQIERAESWDSGANEVILKRRQVGLTWEAVYFAQYCGLFKTGHSAIISKGKYEANEFIRKITTSMAFLPGNWQQDYKGTDPIKFANGNLIHALPSTKDGGISFTFARIFTDEAAMHPYGWDNYSQYQATIANGQHLIFSAANPDLGPSGFFYDKWMEATEGKPWQVVGPNGTEPWKHGDSRYKPVFIGRWARPDQDDKWFAKQKKAYKGNPEIVDVVYPEWPEQAFLGKSGLVLPEFSSQLHVSPHHPMAWEDYTYRFASIDPGGGDPTAIVPLGAWRDPRRGVVMYHQPGEFYSRNAVTADHLINYLAQWHQRAPFTRIWIDTAGGEVLLNTLRAYFGKTVVWPAIKDREMGLITYREVLADSRITLHESCAEGIKEFAGYRWLNRPDPNSHEKFVTGTPFDHHADAHDARRYTLIGAETAFLRMAASEPIRKYGESRVPKPLVRWVV